jgi:hypothetical protein
MKKNKKHYLLRYTIQNGDFEYPDFTVFQATDDAAAQKEATQQLNKDGWLNHDSWLEAIWQNDLTPISKKDADVLTKLRLI